MQIKHILRNFGSAPRQKRDAISNCPKSNSVPIYHSFNCWASLIISICKLVYPMKAYLNDLQVSTSHICNALIIDTISFDSFS